ncbi:MAG: hypothetical protein ABI972_18270 [Acidobacteriota bacterium]
MLALLLAPAGFAQRTTTELEQRVSELEQTVKLLQSKLDQVLAAGAPVSAGAPVAASASIAASALLTASAPSMPVPTAAQVPLTPAASTGVVSQAPLQSVFVSGDFQKSADSETRLPVAGYMDFHVNRDSGDAFRPDFHRFVLLFGHSFSDRIKFWSELEVEHAIVEGGEEGGELALEQAYLDFLITPKFNVRAGMLLAPVGIVNERHEPPAFNGVERPFVESIIIPTTWHELGFGFTGDLGRGFRYRTYLTSALDASRFNAEFGIAEGKTGGFDASMRNPATVGRLEFAGVRRLTIGASLYSGLAGFNTPGTNPRVTIADVDGRYSYRRFDIRGLFANTWVSRAGELNARLQRQIGVNPNVASQMRGYYLEPGYHLLPRRFRKDVIAFARYENYDTQRVMPRGFVPLRQFDRTAWVTGITFKPVPDVAIKFDYAFNRNESAVVRALNGINLGIGWWF